MYKQNSIEKLNLKALKVISDYQHIVVGNCIIDTPYFINSAEQFYIESMKAVGIQDELVSKAIRIIKDAKTPLGSTRGKGSPAGIKNDIIRLKSYLMESGFDFDNLSETALRTLLVKYHIGIDCSGFVYNLLELVFKPIFEGKVKPLFAWADILAMRSSRASVDIFNSEKLLNVSDLKNMQPLDILVFRGNRHVGIVVSRNGVLQMADSALSTNGITTSKISIGKHTFIVESRNEWNRVIRTRGVSVKRIPFLDPPGVLSD